MLRMNGERDGLLPVSGVIGARFADNPRPSGAKLWLWMYGLSG